MVLPRFDRRSLNIPTSSPSTMHRDGNALDPTDPKHVGNQSFPISPGIVGSSDPPPVPECIPREPVPQCGRGEGWPYAPQGWPKPDDKWGWRVGKRASASALWSDRYVTLPTSLLKGRRAIEFASRKSLVEYCKLNFPQMTDPLNIFKAFDWKVPAPKDLEPTARREPTVKRDIPPPTHGDAICLQPKKPCRAGNPHCILTEAKDGGSELLGSLVCRICCSEPSFCRECKCILCCEFFQPTADSVRVVRCLNLPVPGQGICGHAAHLECALNSQLAGVIKKNGLDLEYICRRCDRKTDLRDTISHLVEAMVQNATQFMVENILQLALRTVQDLEDEAQSPGKTWVTLIADALKKVREGAVIAEVYEELTEQLHGPPSGQGVHDCQVSHRVFNWSRARGQKSAWEDSLHPSEANSEKLAAHVISVGSPDLPSRLRAKDKSQSKPLGRTQQGGLYDASPAVQRVGALPVCHGGDGVATTSDTRLQPVLTVEPSNHLLQCIPSLLSRLNQSVCKPPALSVEEHERQCEAISERVKRAGQLKSPSGEVVVPDSSSSEATSRSLSNSQDAGGDDVVSGQSAEAPTVEPPTVPSLGMTLVARLEAKCEGEISEALEKLKRVHASEYASAKASLNNQKNILVEQYRKLVHQKDNHQLLKNQNDEARPAIDRAQLQKAQEVQNVFESMLAISHGFGQVPKEFLGQFFNWPPSDTAEA